MNIIAAILIIVIFGALLFKLSGVVGSEIFKFSGIYECLAENKRNYINILIKIIQAILMIIIPAIMIFTIMLCASESFQNFIIPNPQLSMTDEVMEHSFFPIVFNYALIFIYSYLNKRYTKASNITNRLVFIYGLINTILFAYYFYMNFIFDTGMWHLFKTV